MHNPLIRLIGFLSTTIATLFAVLQVIPETLVLQVRLIREFLAINDRIIVEVQVSDTVLFGPVPSQYGETEELEPDTA